MGDKVGAKLPITPGCLAIVGPAYFAGNAVAEYRLARIDRRCDPHGGGREGTWGATEIEGYGDTPPQPCGHYRHFRETLIQVLPEQGDLARG